MRRNSGNFIGYYFEGQILYVIGAAIVGFLCLCMVIYVAWWLLLIGAVIWGIVWLVKKVSAAHGDSTTKQTVEGQTRETPAEIEQKREKGAKAAAVAQLCSALNGVVDKQKGTDSTRREDRTS